MSLAEVNVEAVFVVLGALASLAAITAAHGDNDVGGADDFVDPGLGYLFSVRPMRPRQLAEVEAVAALEDVPMRTTVFETDLNGALINTQSCKRRTDQMNAT